MAANRRVLFDGPPVRSLPAFLHAQSFGGSPNARHFGPFQLADWNASRRACAFFDVKGDGHTLVKLSFGRYRVAPNASLGFNSNPNSNQWWSQYDWADLNQNGVWEPGEEARRQRRRGGDAIESLDPGLKLPLLDEAGAWIERSLSGGVALRLARSVARSFPYRVRMSKENSLRAFTVRSHSDRGRTEAVTGDYADLDGILSPSNYFGQRRQRSP